MNIAAIRRYEMFVRVKEFGAAHVEAFPSDSLGAQTFAVVAAAVDTLQAQMTAQASGDKKEALHAKATARQALRTALEAISRTARAIATDVPGVDDKFRLPHSRGDQQLIAAGRAFAQNAASLIDQFTSHNMPPTFVADLNSTVGAFERAILVVAAVKEDRAAATKAIPAAISAGDAAVRRLDAIVANQMRGDEEALAMWANARRVSRLRTGGGRPAAPPAPAPAPVLTHTTA